MDEVGATAVVSRRPKSRQEYLTLSDDTPGELIDGQLVVWSHPWLPQLRLRTAWPLRSSLSLRRVCCNERLGWAVGGDVFIPDVLVHPETTAQTNLTGVPPLVVEVLSDDRPRDLTDRLAAYAPAGAPHCWVVELSARTVEVLGVRAGRYRRELLVSAPTTIDFGA